VHEHRPGDELDGLLTEFFRADMPHAWPAPALPQVWPSPVADAPGALLSAPRRSRFALAASIAILLGGQLWLHRSYQPEPSTATRPAPPVDVASRPGEHGKPPKEGGELKSSKPGASKPLSSHSSR
jgi:hypothetical protein